MSDEQLKRQSGTALPAVPSRGSAPSPGSSVAPQFAGLAPLARVGKLSLMMTQFAVRGIGHGAVGAAVVPMRFDHEVFNDLLAMQGAILQRCVEEQQGWFDGLAAIAECYTQSRRANTLSKAFEQEYDIMSRLGALMADRSASWLDLLENIQVDYAYWVTELARPSVTRQKA